MNQGQYEQALAKLNAHLAKAPQDAEARFTRGLLLIKTNRTDEALKAFADLTRDYPQLPEPYNNLAVLYAQQGEYEKARDALEAALATHPSYATAHENLGDIYAALASTAYNRALQLDQGNTKLRAKLKLMDQLDTLQEPTAIAQAPKSVPSAPPLPNAKPAPPPAAAAPKPAAPAPPPAATAPPVTLDLTAEARAEIGKSVAAWAAAWSAKDADGYLAAYAPEFRPDGGIGRRTWEKQRRERIAKPKTLSVEVVDPKIELMGPGRAKATFLQRYRSDNFGDEVQKVLELTESGGVWRIARETAR